MNEPEPKSEADYARELKDRQRLFGPDSDRKLTSGINYTAHQTDEPGQFILEYAGGRRVLVKIDPATGKEYFLREL